MTADWSILVFAGGVFQMDLPFWEWQLAGKGAVQGRKEFQGRWASAQGWFSRRIGFEGLAFSARPVKERKEEEKKNKKKKRNEEEERKERKEKKRKERRRR